MYERQGRKFNDFRYDFVEQITATQLPLRGAARYDAMTRPTTVRGPSAAVPLHPPPVDLPRSLLS
jgi:hypothetical protein